MYIAFYTACFFEIQGSIIVLKYACPSQRPQKSLRWLKLVPIPQELLCIPPIVWSAGNSASLIASDGPKSVTHTWDPFLESPGNFSSRVQNQMFKSKS